MLDIFIFISMILPVFVGYHLSRLGRNTKEVVKGAVVYSIFAIILMFIAAAFMIQYTEDKYSECDPGIIFMLGRDTYPGTVSFALYHPSGVIELFIAVIIVNVIFAIIGNFIEQQFKKK